MFMLEMYNGEGEWTAAKKLWEIVEMGEEFIEYIPNLHYSLLPIHQMSREELEKYGKGLGAVFLLEQGFGEEEEELKKRLEEASKMLFKEEKELVQAIGKWFQMRLKGSELEPSLVEEILEK
ncbi:MAG: hypothetical protein D6785_05765 [Planctomycetota bacterium]|nr:MAG: hypothetical protein D6785_05765 [Planctomycetota bacterium]